MKVGHVPIEGAVAPAAKKKIDWAKVAEFVKTKEFMAGAGAFVAILFAFWPLLSLLPANWMNFDSHYGHGLLIPPAAAYIIYARWSKMKDIPVKGSIWALALLLPTLYLAIVASRTVMPLVLSVAFITTLFAAVWYVAGFKWALALSPAIGFLILGLPVLDRVVDSWTFKLQLVSTDVAEGLLKLTGHNVLRSQATLLSMDNFDLNIAGACSGLKTTIAVSASVVFFMLVTPLRWWANAVLAVVAVPLSVFINGLRITMIGMVGNANGTEAGMQFHDYSGFIALVVCFFILAKLTKFLEVKS